MEKGGIANGCDWDKDGRRQTKEDSTKTTSMGRKTKGFNEHDVGIWRVAGAVTIVAFVINLQAIDAVLAEVYESLKGQWWFKHDSFEVRTGTGEGRRKSMWRVASCSVAQLCALDLRMGIPGLVLSGYVEVQDTR